MQRFENHHAVVTGGTSGIGLATARRLAAEGARVLVTGREPDALAAAADIDRVTAVRNDASDIGDVAELRAAAVEHLGGRVDAVFLNAGFGAFQPLGSIESVEIARQFDVNVRGPLLHLDALADLIVDGGSVLFNTSVVNDLGMPGSAVYSASKGAVRSAMRVFANELAARSVRVNAISPGPIDTGFFARTGLSDEEIEGFAAQVVSQVPLGRFGQADEVAAAAAFLLSTDASYITGAELVVDGGMS
jgi:NAD(P)-dependent dehydrogenase (short-subunit alcohol dehydrogenase family)